MNIRIFSLLLLTLGFGCPVSHALTSGNNPNNGTGKIEYTAGCDKDLPVWYGFKPMGFNDARKAGKPILLYVYDPANKSNGPAKTLETIFFKNEEKTTFVVDPELKAALAGFTMIWVPKSTTAWPEFFTKKVGSTYSLFLLQCNGAVMSSNEGGKVPNVKLFAQTAQSMEAGNAMIVEQLKKNPPPDWISDSDKAALASTKPEKEVAAKKDKVSALLERDSKDVPLASPEKDKDEKPAGALPGDTPKKKAPAPTDAKLKDEDEKNSLPPPFEGLARGGKVHNLLFGGGLAL